MQNKPIDLSVISPLYNEESNVGRLYSAIKDELTNLELNYEIILVDDGSTDDTLMILQDLAARNDDLRIVSYTPNRGRGNAIRAGFKAARGKYLVTIDADLSYTPDHITQIFNYLNTHPATDVVIGSPYMKGGRTENVPFMRLAISRLGNILLQYAVGKGIRTISGILRGYKKEVIDGLLLESDGKEIHLEILTKLLALNYKVKEIPAVLRCRKKGRSKFKFRATAFSHLIYSFFDRPAILFGFAGSILLLLGLIGGLYIVYLWQIARLNPERPLVNLVILLIISGVQIFFFGFLATQLVLLRNELFKLQRQNKEIKQAATNKEKSSDQHE